MRDAAVKDAAKGTNILGEMLDQMKAAKAMGYFFILDSGAYTYQAKQSSELKERLEEAGLKKSDVDTLGVDKVMETLSKLGLSTASAVLPEPRKYFEEYRAFCTQYGHLFDIMVELDIEGCLDGKGGYLTQSTIDSWTDELLQGPHAQKIMPVYHPQRGLTWLRDWLMDTSSPYVGFGSDPAQADAASGLIARIHKAGKWVHGFGQAGLKSTLKRRPFDSVDASTWLRADKYGGSFLIRQSATEEMLSITVLTHKEKGADPLYAVKGKIKQIRMAQGVPEEEAGKGLEVLPATGGKRRMFDAFYRKHGLDPKAIYKDDLDANRRATLIAWREICKHYESMPWQPPYLWQWTQDGVCPLEHPILTRVKQMTRDGLTDAKKA